MEDEILDWMDDLGIQHRPGHDRRPRIHLNLEHDTAGGMNETLNADAGEQDFQIGIDDEPDRLTNHHEFINTGAVLPHVRYENAIVWTTNLTPDNFIALAPSVHTMLPDLLKPHQLPPCALCSEVSQRCTVVAVDAYNQTRICTTCMRRGKGCYFPMTSITKPPGPKRGKKSRCAYCEAHPSWERCVPVVKLSELVPLRCENCWLRRIEESCELPAWAVKSFINTMLEARSELVLTLERAGAWDALLEQGDMMEEKGDVEEMVRWMEAPQLGMLV